MNRNYVRKPEWLKVGRSSGDQFHNVRKELDRCSLHTVCEEANCPNQAECWSAGTATFMILGDICTRGCVFCAVKRGNPGGVTDIGEPPRVAKAVSEMGLDYVVVTSVTRDDLSDGGSSVFAETIADIGKLERSPHIEVLVPDYQDRDLNTILRAGPDVVAHNLEVVERLSTTYRHSRFDFKRSLQVLEQVSREGTIIPKSSLMLGVGETDEEVERAMDQMLNAGVKVLFMGQYLSPTRNHVPVSEYISPEKFANWGERGRQLGFNFVAAGPFVRTSYRAAEAYRHCHMNC